MTVPKLPPTETQVADARKIALAWLEAGRPVAMATVIDTWGSAPVRTGGQLAIASETEFQGSVSGGCVEADVIAAGLDVLQSGTPQTLDFGVTDETAWRAGLACGGKIRVHVAGYDPSQDLDFARRVDAAVTARHPIVVATDLQDGTREIIETAEARADIGDRFASGKSGIDASGQTFFHTIAPPWRILIVGATHIAQHLAQMATACGYDVRIVDPRSAFASPHRFDASQLVGAWPSDAFASLGTDPFTALVTLTHVDSIDDEALTLALRTSCGYIGSLGSRKTHAKRVERLKSAGFADADIARIHAPIGLSIGAATAPEIAASILAEIIAAFRKPEPK